MAPPRRVILAEAAGLGPVGYLGLDAAASEVLHLYVAPAWQGCGIGAFVGIAAFPQIKKQIQQVVELGAVDRLPSRGQIVKHFDDASAGVPHVNAAEARCGSRVFGDQPIRRDSEIISPR